MSYQNDKEAYDLAVTYGLMPIPAGKYEPDATPEAATRCIVLAHYNSACNLLILYHPADLPE